MNINGGVDIEAYVRSTSASSVFSPAHSAFCGGDANELSPYGEFSYSL